MDAYQLATLVEWAGTFKSRKRLQKVIFFLREKGCPLQVEYILHHYGPYSSDVAQCVDSMVQSGFLEESSEPNSVGGQTFSYQLAEAAKKKLEELRGNDAVSGRLEEFNRFEAFAKQLIDEPDLKKLEYSATIAYIYKRNKVEEWESAREAAAKFKKQDRDSSEMLEAENYAKQLLEEVEISC